jgi:hypothetical protein
MKQTFLFLFLCELGFRAISEGNLRKGEEIINFAFDLPKEDA